MALHRELGPVLWVEAEMLVLDLRRTSQVINPFTSKETFYRHFFGHTESIAILQGAETHWQDNWQSR